MASSVGIFFGEGGSLGAPPSRLRRDPCRSEKEGADTEVGIRGDHRAIGSDNPVDLGTIWYFWGVDGPSLRLWVLMSRIDLELAVDVSTVDGVIIEKVLVGVILFWVDPPSSPGDIWIPYRFLKGFGLDPPLLPRMLCCEKLAVVWELALSLNVFLFASGLIECSGMLTNGTLRAPRLCPIRTFLIDRRDRWL